MLLQNQTRDGGAPAKSTLMLKEVVECIQVHKLIRNHIPRSRCEVSLFTCKLYFSHPMPIFTIFRSLRVMWDHPQPRISCSTIHPVMEIYVIEWTIGGVSIMLIPRQMKFVQSRESQRIATYVVRLYTSEPKLFCFVHWNLCCWVVHVRTHFVGLCTSEGLAHQNPCCFLCYWVGCIRTHVVGLHTSKPMLFGGAHPNLY